MSAVNPTAQAADLYGLVGQPFELLFALENRLRAARLDIAAGQTQSWTGLGFRLREHWLVLSLHKLTRSMSFTVAGV